MRRYKAPAIGLLAISTRKANEKRRYRYQSPEGTELYTLQPGRSTISAEQHEDKCSGSKRNHFDGVEYQVQRMAGEEADQHPHRNDQENHLNGSSSRHRHGNLHTILTGRTDRPI